MKYIKFVKIVARAILGDSTYHQIKIRLGKKTRTAKATSLPDVSASDNAVITAVENYTMTSLERRYVLLEAVRHVHRMGLPGSLVECGVWRGGSAMIMASESLILQNFRELYLYDTFEGMPPPDSVDKDYQGVAASVRLGEEFEKMQQSHVWAYAQIDVVKSNLQSTNYPDHLIHYVQGKVEETIPSTMPDQIALLRLDTDWYASTKHELEYLYPRLVSGGVLIIDDYGYWQGARQAVDDFFAAQENPPMLIRIDSTGRIAIKP